MEFLTQLQPWHWFVLAVLLFALEITATVGFFIGIATAALVISALMFLGVSIGWTGQFAIFGVLSVVLTVAYKKYFKGFNDETDSPLLNDRAAQLVGHNLVLEESLNERGAIMIHDTRWRVECEGSIPAGSKVTVSASNGMTLVLTPA